MEHVTVPKTHDDKVDENTGYVKALKMAQTKMVERHLMPDLIYRTRY
jgi:hypothetical protein